MAYKWTPPPGYSEFIYHGKSYKPGDMIPISKELAIHHMQAGHNWEDLDAPEAPAPGGSPVPAAHPAGKSE